VTDDRDVITADRDISDRDHQLACCDVTGAYYYFHYKRKLRNNAVTTCCQIAAGDRYSRATAVRQSGNMIHVSSCSMQLYITAAPAMLSGTP